MIADIWVCSSSVPACELMLYLKYCNELFLQVIVPESPLFTSTINSTKTPAFGKYFKKYSKNQETK